MKCVTQGARDMGHETSNNGIDAVERMYDIYIYINIFLTRYWVLGAGGYMGLGARRQQH